MRYDGINMQGKVFPRQNDRKPWVFRIFRKHCWYVKARSSTLIPGCMNSVCRIVRTRVNGAKIMFEEIAATDPSYKRYEYVFSKIKASMIRIFIIFLGFKDF